MLALAGSSGSAAAATHEPVKVRAATHEGFGRLVFEWPAPITVDSRRHGDRLTFRFARPFAADLSTVLGALGDYVVGLEHGADAREVVLRLAPAITARLDIDDDRIVVVDLMRAAQTSRSVAVRTGTHDGFLRIVLDWPRSIAFAAEADGRQMRVHFDRAAEIDASTIAERCRALLDSASADQSDGSSDLRLVLKPGVMAKVFKVEDHQAVIDLYEPSHAPPAADVPEIVPAQALEKPESPASAAPKPALPKPRSSSLAPSDATLAGPEPAAAPPQAGSPLTLKTTSTKLDERVALDFVWSRPAAAAFLVRAGYLWSVFAPIGAPGDDVALPSLASPASTWVGPGERVDATGGVALRFPMRRPFAIQVQLAEGGWRLLLGAAVSLPEAVRLERLPDPPRLRIVTGEAAHLVHLTDPEVGDRLDVWPLRAPGRGQPQPERLVDLELLATAQGLAWRANVDRLRAEAVDGALELSVPGGLRLSADSLVPPASPAQAAEPPAYPAAAPLAESAGESQAAGSTAPRPAEGRATESAKAPVGTADHGAPATTPALTAAAGTDHPGPVAHARPAPGPAERPGSTEVNQPAPVPPAAAVSPPLGLARFAPATRGSLGDRRAFWQQRVLNADAADRPAAGLDLARFFLAHALGAEALAVLGAAGPDDQSAAGARLDVARQSLSSAAQLLMGRLNEAAVGLGAAAPDRDPEAALWRAVLAAARSDWPRAAQELERSGTTLDGYPLPLQFRLGLPAARIAIETGNQDEAARLLGRLRALELGPIERDQVAFLDGLAHARRGAIDDADRIWKGLGRSEDYRTRIEAEDARVQLQFDAGRLTPAEALARLVAARPLWRAHPQEPRMLDGLARLYLRNGEPSPALHVWQEVLSRFPEAPDAARIAKAMRDNFIAALLPEDGTGLGPLRAFALYRDFPELVPDGALGERLRRRLAIEIAGLDLIRDAADLLEPLIDRLDGPAKAEIGAELAELWLRQPDPVKALAALDRSRVGAELPEGLSVRRQVLRAQAVVAQGEPDAALALLEGQADRTERQLRAQILWQQRDWPRLIAALEDLLAMRADPAAPLSDVEQDFVVELAVADARQGDAGALKRLQARFGKAMHGQPGEAAFLMATLAPARPAEPEAVVAAADEQLKRVQAYLAGVRAPR